MVMPGGLRKLVLTAHVATSAGLMGAVATFLVLAIAGMITPGSQTQRAAYVAMDLAVRWAIVPLVVASLLSGLLQSLGTSWGLFRHYWVLAKFLLAVFVLIVLLLQLDLIEHVAAIAAAGTLSGAGIQEMGTSLVLHAAGGLVVLLTATTLSVYKPRGLTRYGWRKQQAQRAAQPPRNASPNSSL